MHAQGRLPQARHTVSVYIYTSRKNRLATKYIYDSLVRGYLSAAVNYVYVEEVVAGSEYGHNVRQRYPTPSNLLTWLPIHWSK